MLDVTGISALSIASVKTNTDVASFPIIDCATLNPTLNAVVTDGILRMTEIKPEIKIPSIDFKFTPKECHINKSRIQIEHSDFNLSGDVTNIKNHIEKNGLLKGNLKFESDQTNVDEIMNLVNGIGNEKEATSSFSGYLSIYLKER